MVPVEGRDHPVGAAQDVLRRNGFDSLRAPDPHDVRRLGAQRGGLALRAGAVTEPKLLVCRAGVKVLLPRHVVDVDLAAHGIEEPHPVHHLGQQIVIVADHHQPAGVRLEEVTQPTQRVGVEMVGRLVEQQGGGMRGAGLGSSEKDPRDLDPPPFAGGQGPKRPVEGMLGKVEVRADTEGFTLGGVSADGGELLLELTVAAKGTVAGDVIGCLGHQGSLLFQVGKQPVHAARRQHPVAGQRVQVHLFGILWQVTDLTVLGHGACIGVRGSGENTHDHRLACAVFSDQSDAITEVHLQRRPGHR